MILMMEDDKPIIPKFCGSCGKILLQGATYCAYCGAAVPDLSSPSITGAKPAPYTPPSPSSYPPSSPPPYFQKPPTDPPLPFFQHLQGIILSPREEMSRIAKRPNIGQPLLIIAVIGILAGIALFIYHSKVTIVLTDNFKQEFNEMMMGSSELGAESFIDFFVSLMPFMMVFGLFMNWIIFNGVILWILHSIISSGVPAHKRSFKTILTIIGWSSLPLILEELINFIYVLFFVSKSTITMNSLADLALLETIETTGSIGLILVVFSLLIQIVSVILVYFAVKSIDPYEYHAIVITVLYAILPFALSFVLSGFLPFL